MFSKCNVCTQPKLFKLKYAYSLMYIKKNKNIRFKLIYILSLQIYSLLILVLVNSFFVFHPYNIQTVCFWSLPSVFVKKDDVAEGVPSWHCHIGLISPHVIWRWWHGPNLILPLPLPCRHPASTPKVYSDVVVESHSRDRRRWGTRWGGQEISCFFYGIFVQQASFHDTRRIKSHWSYDIFGLVIKRTNPFSSNQIDFYATFATKAPSPKHGYT